MALEYSFLLVNVTAVNELAMSHRVFLLLFLRVT